MEDNWNGKYVWKSGMFGVTEESYELLEVNVKVIMNGDGEVKWKM